MQLTEKHKEYWSRTVKLTAVLLLIWFVITFVMGFFARELNQITIAGFPLAFYMGAQGSLILYIAIIGYYAKKMGQLDREYGVDEEEE